METGEALRQPAPVRAPAHLHTSRGHPQPAVGLDWPLLPLELHPQVLAGFLCARLFCGGRAEVGTTGTQCALCARNSVSAFTLCGFCLGIMLVFMTEAVCTTVYTADELRGPSSF